MPHQETVGENEKQPISGKFVSQKSKSISVNQLFAAYKNGNFYV